MNAISILSLIVSFGALLFSFLNFKRGKRFDNENHLYKTKVEIYSKILGHLVKLIYKLEANHSDGEEYLKDKTTEAGEALNKQADEIDDLIEEFVILFISNSLIIPSKILNMLENYMNILEEVDPIDPYLNNNEDSVKKLDITIDKITDVGDSISALLRDDLKIEDLNTSLYKRIK
jgi:hypothetical protein